MERENGEEEEEEEREEDEEEKEKEEDDNMEEKEEWEGQEQEDKQSQIFSWCVPGLNQACKRILPPLPGQGQYSLRCWRGSLARPRPKTGCWGRIIIFVVVCCIVLYSVQYSTLN